jgi:addiction module HigA family antidote
MKNPPHPGDFIRTEIVELAGLTVTDAAKALQVSRPALSSLLNSKAGLSGDMALRIEKAFGVKMETLMRMQSAYDISQSRNREEEIRARRSQTLPGLTRTQAADRESKSGLVVRHRTVAPLYDLRMGPRESFNLAPDASLAPVPDWLRKDKSTLARLSQQDRDELAACTHCFLREYEVDQAAEMVARLDHKSGKRSAKGFTSDLVYLANLALWLQRLPNVGFNLVFHAHASSGATNIIDPPRRHGRFLYHPNDEIHRRRITADDLAASQQLYAALCKIPRHSAPWTACRAVTSALQMERNEIRHLLLWVALEALFGNKDGEIKYRLSQRLAFFIANDRTEAKEIFLKAKRGYNARCDIAHGNWGTKTQNTHEAVALTGTTEELVRRGLVRILQDDETIKQFCRNDRGDWLDLRPFLEFISHPESVPILAEPGEDPVEV